MSKWQHREEGKRICKSVIQDKTKEELLGVKSFLDSLLDLRKSEKLSKTYIDGTQKAVAYNGTDKVFVDYRFDGTTTGRLSCASYNAKEAMGVSFHTLPRSTSTNIRSVFTAPEGWCFLAADYSAMELRVLSHIAKDGNMQTAFNQGEDLHTYTAKLLFNKEKISKTERQIAKTVSFLIVYGGGAFNLSETMGIPMRRAEGIITNYKNVYPGVFEYMDFVNSFIKTNGYAYTIFGRKRNLPDVYSSHSTVVNRALRQGLNFTIQSSASDILLSSLVGLHKRMTHLGMESRIVATVHDSIEFISPPKEVEKLSELIYDELVNYPYIKDKFNILFDVPLAIDLELGHSFGDGKAVTFTKGKPDNVEELLCELFY
jgi:DNA polymerase-1